MRRDTTSSIAVFRQGLVALVCACALAFNLFAFGHARGVVATQHVETAMTAAAKGLPCPLPYASPTATVCTFSVFATGALVDESALPRPSATARISFMAFADDRAQPSSTLGAPFRPPRQG